MNIPPNPINDFLTRRALDEPLGLAQDGHLDRVPDSVLQHVVVIIVLSRAREERVGRPSVHRPARGEREGEVEHVLRVRAEGTCREDLAQVRARLRERGGRQVAVAHEVDAVEEQAEDDGEVALPLERAVFLLERPDECIG